MPERTHYLILIFVHPGKLDVLRQYERHAARLMERHGGKFERVFRPQTQTISGVENGEVPDEIHLLSFATPDGFQAFRADPDLNPFNALRDEAVRRAIVLPVTDYPLTTYFAE